jgi:hypothetical protein
VVISCPTGVVTVVLEEVYPARMRTGPKSSPFGRQGKRGCASLQPSSHSPQILFALSLVLLLLLAVFALAIYAALTVAVAVSAVVEAVAAVC